MLVIIRLQPSVAAGWQTAIRSCRVAIHAFGAAAVGVALCATATTDVTARVPSWQSDPRIERLESFFQAYNCPQPHHTMEYLRAADNYGLDYRLLPAVSIRETTCGVAERQNNRWGYHPGRQSFPSIEVGIDYVARQLAENPYYKGKSLEEKLFTYNPRPKYPKEVQRIMQQIE